MIPGGSYANRETLRGFLKLPKIVPEYLLLMASDAQTSGGLLLAVPPDAMAEFEGGLESKGGQAWEIGTFQEGPAAITLSSG